MLGAVKFTVTTFLFDELNTAAETVGALTPSKTLRLLNSKLVGVILIGTGKKVVATTVVEFTPLPKAMWSPVVSELNR